MESLLGKKMQNQIKCPAITAKGKPCPIIGEESRNSWCHVHDPFGENQTKIRQVREHKAKNGGKSGIVNKKILAKEQQLRESIALDIEGQCSYLMSSLCNCEFHKAANIARHGSI
jgi:hypothetical protein